VGTAFESKGECSSKGGVNEEQKNRRKKGQENRNPVGTKQFQRSQQGKSTAKRHLTFKKGRGEIYGGWERGICSFCMSML